MNLVQFLVAGVNGAASGSATFFLRGTASSAAAVLYNDFEGIAQPGTNVITLDANGAAEVYCDAYVDVEIKNSAGTTLRTVTVGNSAPLVEVQSTSFTGTDYDGSPANTIGEPITLKALLDKWIISAGTTNWQVLVDGAPTNLQAAVIGFSGMFVNVKDPTYGALGDTVTDDTVAILAATTAADGGIVFFPPGTYKITTLALTGDNINWMGSGDGATIISGTTETVLIDLQSTIAGTWKNFRDMSFASSSDYNELFSLKSQQNVSFRNCSFDASNCSDAAILWDDTGGLAKGIFVDCDFTLGAATANGLLNESSFGNRHISVKGCSFTVPDGFTGDILHGPDMMVEGCRFDASLVESGVYYHVDAEDGATPGRFVGNFVGNTFLDGGSSGFAFDLRDITEETNFIEDDNTFIGFATPTEVTDAGHIYDTSTPGSFSAQTVVRLGSRRGKMVVVTFDDSGSLQGLACQLVAETVFVDFDHNGVMEVIVNDDIIPPGCDYNLYVSNVDAADNPHNISLTMNGESFTEPAVGVDRTAFFGIKTVYKPDSFFPAAFGLSALCVWQGTTILNDA